MDSVYLTPPAARRFEALSLSLPSACGLLLGHKRAHTSIVEDVLPTGKDLLSDPSVYDSLTRIYEDGIVGFFAAPSNEEFFQSLLCPTAFGKIVISFEPGRNTDPVLTHHMISFNGDFYLEPVSIEGP